MAAPGLEDGSLVAVDRSLPRVHDPRTVIGSTPLNRGWAILARHADFGRQATRHALETPEIHPPHAKHAGGLPQWLEMIIAITALITSISSIVIAIHHGHVMEMLVQANSFPYLQAGFSDATPEGAKVLSLDLVNHGVGPAHEISLRVKSGDKYVTSIKELFDASLGPEQSARAKDMLHPLWNAVRTRFVPGGQSQLVFRLARTADNAQFWDVIDRNQQRWDVEYCYCSVFQECWEVHSQWQEPEHVKQCRRDEPHEFMPEGRDSTP